MGFGDVQARLFPKMGMVCMSMSGIAMATYLQKHSADLAFALLTSSLVINAVNSLVVFPVTTGYMYERRKHEEGTPERKQAEKMFHIHHEFPTQSTLDQLWLTLRTCTFWHLTLSTFGRSVFL